MTVRVFLTLFFFIPLAACSNGLFGQKEAVQAEEQARREAVLQMERQDDQQRARVDMLEGEMGRLRRELGMIRSDITNLVLRVETVLNPSGLPDNKKRNPPVKVVPVEEGKGEQEQSRDAMAETPAIPSASDTEPGDIHYGLHLASYRSRDLVLDGWNELLAKYPDLLADHTARVSVLDMASFGGIYYRLKAGPVSDKTAADDLCRQFQAAGEYCVVAEFTGDPLN